MLQFGMRAHDFSQPEPAEKFLHNISQGGIEHIQLAFEKCFSDLDVTTGHYSAGLAHYIGSLLRENDLHCAVLGCYINPVVPDEELRKVEIERFTERLRYAKHIGADMVATETGRFSLDFSVTDRTQSKECYETLLQSFAEICTQAQALGVVVGVEGVFDHTLSTPKKMAQFLRDLASPNLEVVFDFANLISPLNTSVENQRRIAEEAFELYGDRISVLHLKDFVFDSNGTQRCVIPGTGLVDYRPMMKWIKQNKPYIIGLLEESTPERYKNDCAFFAREWNNV